MVEDASRRLRMDKEHATGNVQCAVLLRGSTAHTSRGGPRAQQKLGLCIGINNYPGTSNDLAGCVNDANDWSAELRKRGFAVDTLLDKQATKTNITNGMMGLLEKAKGDDVVVITYSGHGTWQADDDDDEPDGRDEALCPYDVSGGPLLDDELYDIFSTRARGTRLVFLSDSCHSGSVAKLYPEPNIERKIRFMSPVYYQPSAEKLARLRAVEKTASRGRSRSSALLISGCADVEYSYDTSFGGRPNGAFTRVALDVLDATNPATYRDWFSAIKKRLPSCHAESAPPAAVSNAFA